ncbi:MAG: hypothetical protein ACI4RA_04735 [Kiritimatiellia bacterium]
MAKQVIVLGLEGSTLRGVRLDAVGDEFQRGAVEAWPLVVEEEQGDEAAEGADFTVEEEAPAATEEIADADKPLARALRAAVKAFGTHEFVLSLPLSKLLVKTVRLPVEAREDVLGAAQLELDGISPFPDEVLTPGAEIMAETEKEIVAVVAALPDAASAEITEALAAAKVNVLRTDTTALAWLRGLWPNICEKPTEGRRLVLLNLDEGWDLAVIDEGAPSFLRGLGAVAGPAELGREITLSLLSMEGGPADVADVVVCSRARPEQEIRDRLAEFGPVRTIGVTDDFAGVEGAARRVVEGSALDVTPAAWTEDRIETRFRRKLMLGLSIAGGVWLAVMAVLFGVDTTYDLLADHQRSLQKERKHAAAFQDVSAMTNRVALIERYADHAHSALAVLKAVSDSLPPSDEMAFRAFQYRRDESVRVNGSAGAREELRTFTENLEAATFEGEEEPLFAKVQPTGGETQTKKGIRFAVECFFHADESDTTGRKGGH